MRIQFNEDYYKRGYIENANYSYKIEENKEKPSTKNPGKGTWEITEITYYFANGEKAVTEVTDESRPMLRRVKMDDENRMNRKQDGWGIVDLDITEDSILKQPDTYNPIERLELLEYLENAICQLPDKQQRVIRQRYFEDMPTNDIAENEGVNKSAISNREKRALETLKKILSERELAA